ncbi:GTP cyclohydrolase I FolE [Flavobacterium aquatile]|uniref:GTP cyclohydrolase 1 n=1 Tax=Flavobacterium aquatile LMG 4008 = ATCC 11947 TaxID=1453498 RepID=A0A095SQK3_9FLAO|nr:GTP cyclohydrolase I FolE [Flavobacterium aquatile]KGD66951.1 GTP cyclohydrolase [Flavobacterium aquatile LMG 4008 = ATCC 11947]OXA68044.1 GTP cyclohydrolase I [Flavobacterium aquatile] [Flavobacterium aquatile LMG 4008 = ATCC 11947]GEC80074.1 GTP cyclohydrolase 1 [Flavobacterium aquatile]
MGEELLKLNVMVDKKLHADIETPMHAGAFDISDDSKIEIIEECFYKVMHTLGLNLEDDSLKKTPHRVAKMFVKEIFSGLNPSNKPEIKLFKNKYLYDEMLVEKNITLHSYCEHHFVPIIGKVHVAYISSGEVIGLSKINRLVQYYAKRPQVQERLTKQIADGLVKALNTDNVAVIIEADHLCVASRGIKDTNSSTITSCYYGKFKKKSVRSELKSYIV